MNNKKYLKMIKEANPNSLLAKERELQQLLKENELRKPSSIKITHASKNRLGAVGVKGDTYEELINLLIDFKEAHKKQWKAYLNSIKRGD